MLVSITRPLSFDVTFRPAAGPELLLGNVALYPADQPGHFIVPTHNKLQPNGELQVTLRSEDPQRAAKVRVKLGRLTLVNE